MTSPVLAPVAGTAVAMADVPDPVFAQGLLGPGIAIDPDRSGPVDVLAPVPGRIAKLHPHAFVIVDDHGRALLVHLGIDTVQLKGEGFTLHTAEQDSVTAGQVLITWDPGQVATGGRCPVCPVVALESEDLQLCVSAGDTVRAGEEIFSRA